MGMFEVTCVHCGKIYTWISYTPETVARGWYCSHCGQDQRKPTAPSSDTPAPHSPRGTAL